MKCKKILFSFFLFLFLPSISLAANGYLPRDLGNNVIQGTAPDIFSSLSITTGSNTLSVTKDVTVRFICNYPVTYYFGSGTPWPIVANREEFVIVPQGKTTLTINSDVNPTTCYIKEGRR